MAIALPKDKPLVPLVPLDRDLFREASLLINTGLDLRNRLFIRSLRVEPVEPVAIRSLRSVRKQIAQFIGGRS